MGSNQCVGTSTSRKAHNNEAGYIAQLTNSNVPGTHVVIYLAEEQGIDVGGDKYAIVCEAHAALMGTTNLPDARVLMKSVEFCEECMLAEARA